MKADYSDYRNRKYSMITFCTLLFMGHLTAWLGFEYYALIPAFMAVLWAIISLPLLDKIQKEDCLKLKPRKTSLDKETKLLNYYQPKTKVKNYDTL